MYKSIDKKEIYNYVELGKQLDLFFEDVDSNDKKLIIDSLSGIKDKAALISAISRVGREKVGEFFELVNGKSSQEVYSILLEYKGVKKIQSVKEDIISKVFRNSLGDKSYKVDGREVEEMDSMYFDIIKNLNNGRAKGKFGYVKSLKSQIENLFKDNNSYVENGKNHPWKNSYIKDFDDNTNNLNKYILSSNESIEKSLNDRLVSKSDKDKINLFRESTGNFDIPNTRQKLLNFDEQKIENIYKKYSLMKNSLYQKKLEISDLEAKFKIGKNKELESKLDLTKRIISNIKQQSEKIKIEIYSVDCFYEEDLEGNKNYFSYNTLLNYIDTFGVEVGLPKLDLDSIPEDIRKDYFPSFNRNLKKHLSVNILEGLRDKQEILINNLTDFELQKNQKNKFKDGFIAEKVIELEFRELANLSEYDIRIKKSSVGEDMVNKVDLYLELEDKKTGIIIQDELQITLKQDLDLKKKQVEKRNRSLKKEGDYSESQLVSFALSQIGKKVNYWKYYNRPIGKLSDTLDDLEKSTIRETFSRLVKKLEIRKMKKEQLAS